MSVRWLLLLACLLLAPSPGVAAPDVPGFHRLPLNDALAQNTVTAIVQDRRGLMWFATLGGIDVYDGYRFRHLSSDPRDASALAGVAVAAMIEDREGRIWALGLNGWLDRIDPLSGRVTHIAADVAGRSDQPGANSLTLHQDRAGRIWIGSNAGLHRVDGDRVVFNVDARVEQAPLPAVTAITDSADGRLWLGTPEGLVRYAPDTGDRQRWPATPDGPLTEGRISALLEDRAGRLWIGTVDGLFRREADGRLIAFDGAADAPAPAGRYIRSLFQDDAGRIWVGTQSGGLNLYDGHGFVAFRHRPGDPATISNDDVWSLFEDRAGLLWIGTAGGGLNQLNRSTRRFDTVPGLHSAFVWDIAEQADGTLWLVTLAGLERLAPGASTPTLYQPEPDNPGANQLQSVLAGRDGRLWVGSVDGRLYRFDPTGQRFTPVSRPGQPGDRFSRDRIWFMTEDGDGRLWVAVGEGLFALDPARGDVLETVTPSADLPIGAQPVRAAVADDDGTLWFGGGGAGLIRYRRGDGVTGLFGHDPSDPTSLSDNGVRSLYLARDGDLWIGTYNGLNRWSAADRHAGRVRFRLYTTADGLPNNTVYGILPEGDGRHLWLGTNAGLCRLDMQSGEARTYTVSDGLAANEMNGGAEWRSHDGRLYFGSVDGLSTFVPGELPRNLEPPAVAITDVHWYDARGREHAVPADTALELPADASGLRARFAVMDFHQPERNRFRYRLLGPDGGHWVDSDQPEVRLAGLAAGGYRLEVEGANNDGVWSTSPATLGLTVRPPWWRAAPALTGEATLLLLGALWYHRHQRRTLAREREFNEQLSRAHSLAEARHQMALHYARVDQLTQLPNRTVLIDLLGAALGEARRQGRALVLLLLNLDRFQQTNDSIGHALGDRVLQTTSERLHGQLTDDAVLARVGSDEFALMSWLPDDAPADWPEHYAALLQAAVAEPHPYREPPLTITATIGITCFDGAAGSTESAGELLAQADIAMHHGKRHGVAQVVRFSPSMHDSVRERLAIEARLRHALEADEFVAHYQPLVGIASGRLVGFEALIRWQPPDAPQIFPDQFIPVAEDSGLIVELGQWMLRECCRQLSAWRAQGIDGLTVAVNVSLRQLRTGTLVPTLEALLAEFALPPSLLKLEITESAVMENVEDTAEQLAAVRRLGIRVSVDDFGTGFSSLAHLKRLPVSEMKIDRAFVSDVATSAQSRKIVASIVRLAHELGLNTVAEGVEDAACLATLREIGCELAQGYHFSRPLPATELLRQGWLQVDARKRA